MKFIKFMQKYSLYFGIVAMGFAILGTFLEGGSMLQKWFFLLPAIVLGMTAWLNKQKMFMVLQGVVVVGTAIAFFNLVEVIKYSLLIGSGFLAIFYLLKINYIKEDSWWPLGGLGLLILAFGFATDAVRFPIMFNLLLALAGFLIAVYSGIGFFYQKIKIAILWFILNTVFFLNPLRILLSLLR